MKTKRRSYFSLVMAYPLLTGILLLSWLPSYEQGALPVIKAMSGPVDIRDGNHLKKGYWSLLPQRRPDYYFVELPEKSHRVTFITDLDSISFDVSYGRDYDFIILMNGRDSCYTRISARYRNSNFSKRENAVAGPDTIPFVLGDNHKIYVGAQLNGSEVKNVQLDLGAGGTIINTTSVNKVPIDFDGKVNLANSDGINQVRSSSNNRLQIGNLIWDSVPIAVARNMKENEDLIIGNSLFKTKILEINYDKKILVVLDSIPAQIAAYSRHNIILDGGVIPYIAVSLIIRHKTQTGWAMFDTGARTTILNSCDASMTYRIMSQLASIIGLDKAIAPKLNIGSYQLRGFEYKTRDMGKKGLKMILGNDLLKRFNLVFDNKNGYLYMQPNSLTNLPYGKRDEYYVVRIVIALLLSLALIIILKKRRKKDLHLKDQGSN